MGVMNRRDFLKRLGLFPLVLPFLKPFETTLPPIEPKQELNVESMFCMSNPSPYFGPDDFEAFYRATGDFNQKLDGMFADV
jgi:hypothetical protein